MGTMTTTTKRAAAPKKPQDHKPAKSTGTLSVTVRGIALEVPEQVLDDFELVDDLTRMDDGDATRLPVVLRRLAGEQYRELLDTARDGTGHVSIQAGGELVAEVLEALDPNS